MGVDRPCIPEIVIIPHIVQYLLPGQGDSLVFHKVGQKLEFFKTSINLCVVNLNLMGRLVYHDSTRIDDIPGSNRVGPP